MWLIKRLESFLTGESASPTYLVETTPNIWIMAVDEFALSFPGLLEIWLKFATHLDGNTTNRCVFMVISHPVYVLLIVWGALWHRGRRYIWVFCRTFHFSYFCSFLSVVWEHKDRHLKGVWRVKKHEKSDNQTDWKQTNRLFRLFRRENRS